MAKTSIITGVCGQDGAYLAQLLVEKGHTVIGLARRNASLNGLQKLGVNIEIIRGDLCDTFHMDKLIEYIRPDEIYNLAAQSHVGLSFDAPMNTCRVNYGGYLNILLAARRHAPKCRIYQAGTSEMFGYAASERVANEQTPLMPMSPYAISKTAAHWAGVNARYEADQFVSNGILFNHESPLRGDDFVTKKITNFVKTYTGKEVLKLGNLSSIRDWGHAKDYVKAMYLMLQHDYPDDFVIATGATYSVRSFVIAAFKERGYHIDFAGSGVDEIGVVNGKKAIEVSKEFYRPNDLTFLKGDPSKARQMLGWKPEISLSQLISEMIHD